MEMGSVKSDYVNKTLEAFQKETIEETAELKNEQVTAKLEAQQAMEESTEGKLAKLEKRKEKVKNSKDRVNKMMQSGEKADRLLPIQQIKNTADQFQQRNPELQARTLQLLRERIKPGDKAEDILKKLQDMYPDVSLADEALEFLLETTEGELHQQVLAAKEQLNQEHRREIIAGRNISQQAREASKEGIGTHTSMRDLYRDLTGNPRDANTLFQELANKYAYNDVKKITFFLLHALGADLKSKGPSIPGAELQRLFSECRTLQAILGVYRFFQTRMKLIQSMFKKIGLQVPSQLTFETMSKQFMELTGERYPTSDKVLRSAVKLGIDKWLRAKIIALSQLRDAIREVALNQIYRSVQHRDELYMAIIEALENLEDELEELEEREEEEKMR